MRPLTETERQARRDTLADRAADLFGATGWTGLTMDAVAAAAGVAKGTVFLAFGSKEDLVLHAAGRRFDAWFGRLAGVNVTQDPADLARAVAATLASDPLLMPLLGLVGPVLEKGCSTEAVVKFKEGLARNLLALSNTWAPQAPGVPAQAWAPLFLRVYALLVGAWSVAETSQTVRQAVAGRPELEALLTRFDDLVVPMLEAQLRAILGA